MLLWSALPAPGTERPNATPARGRRRTWVLPLVELRDEPETSPLIADSRTALGVVTAHDARRLAGADVLAGYIDGMTLAAVITRQLH